MIEEGNSDTVGGFLINFRKRERIYAVIEEIRQYQQTSFKLSPDPAVIQLLTSFVNYLYFDVALFLLTYFRFEMNK